MQIFSTLKEQDDEYKILMKDILNPIFSLSLKNNELKNKIEEQVIIILYNR